MENVSFKSAAIFMLKDTESWNIHAALLTCEWSLYEVILWL